MHSVKLIYDFVTSNIFSNFCLSCFALGLTKNKRTLGNHSKADVGFLERWTVVRPVSSHSNHFAVWIHSALDDSFHQSVLVLR